MPNDSASGGYLAPENGTPSLSVDGAFDAILQGVVAGIVGLPGTLVRPRWQATPPPEPEVTVDWCAIGVVDESPDLGNASITHVDSEDGGQGADFIQVNDEAQILASFYGPNARGNAALLRNGLMIPQNREALQRQNIALCGIPSPARFVPAIVSMQTQRRVDLTFSLRRANVIEAPVRNLEAARLTLETDRGIEQTVVQGSTPPP